MAKSFHKWDFLDFLIQYILVAHLKYIYFIILLVLILYDLSSFCLAKSQRFLVLNDDLLQEVKPPLISLEQIDRRKGIKSHAFPFR